MGQLYLSKNDGQAAVPSSWTQRRRELEAQREGERLAGAGGAAVGEVEQPVQGLLQPPRRDAARPAGGRAQRCLFEVFTDDE